MVQNKKISFEDSNLSKREWNELMTSFDFTEKNCLALYLKAIKCYRCSIFEQHITLFNVEGLRTLIQRLKAYTF